MSSHSGNSEMSNTQQSNVTRGGERNLNVTVSNNRGDKDKLESSKIFTKYNTAIFMVFTSDGYTGYQGSGFFINSDGLAARFIPPVVVRSVMACTSPIDITLS